MPPEGALKIISIDPAWNREYAVATFEDNIYKDCSLVSISNIGWMLSRNVKLKKGVQVVVEEAYIGVNKKGARNIAYAVGGVLAICEYFKMPCDIMSIRGWKGYHNLEGKTDKMRTVIMKHLVKQITGEEISNIDKQCAILIGQAWIGKNI